MRTLGFDAAGTVEAIGPEVTRFGVGDDVYYAGVTNRPGSNAEFQVVDEHIVGRKPATLDFAQSAALPLTTITAWEGLFDHLGLTPVLDLGMRLGEGSGACLALPLLEASARILAEMATFDSAGVADKSEDLP